MVSGSILFESRIPPELGRDWTSTASSDSSRPICAGTPSGDFGAQRPRRRTVDHAAALGRIPDRITVGGTMSGGGLAAAVCLLARNRGGHALAGQLLIYPMLDDRNDTPSAREFSGIVSWSRYHNCSGWSAMLGEHTCGANTCPYAAPARAADLSGLPRDDPDR